MSIPIFSVFSENGTECVAENLKISAPAKNAPRGLRSASYSVGCHGQFTEKSRSPYVGKGQYFFAVLTSISSAAARNAFIAGMTLSR